MNVTEGLVALLEQAAAELRQRPPPRNWIAQFRDGDALNASDAAFIAGCDAQTIRRWCELREIEHPSRPLGYLVGRLWLVDADELLNEIEHRKGFYSRREAETRLKQFREARRAAPLSIERSERAAG
jgi:hypothetical protein